MTESEAKTKTCPRSIGVQPLYGPDGNGIRDGGPWACLGSECMAWRWLGTTMVPDGEGERRTSTGYCGLAGKP